MSKGLSTVNPSVTNVCIPSSVHRPFGSAAQAGARTPETHVLLGFILKWLISSPRTRGSFMQIESELTDAGNHFQPSIRKSSAFPGARTPVAQVLLSVHLEVADLQRRAARQLQVPAGHALFCAPFLFCHFLKMFSSLNQQRLTKCKRWCQATLR